MEAQLDIAKTLFAENAKVVYTVPGSLVHSSGSGCIILEPQKLKTCPDVDTLLKALSKKVSRVAVMRSQKYSSALCIALLASRGYSITSIELNNVPDTTVEICWESLHNVHISVNEPLKSWLKDIMGSRNYVGYGAQFCQRRFLSSTFDTLGSKVLDNVDFKSVPSGETYMPEIMWDRDDSVYSALSSHFRHEARDVSDNTQ